MHLWQRLHDHYKGDPGKLTLFTIVMLIISEGPMYFFTLLDLLKLPFLDKYRVHYTQEATSHLGKRIYPPWSAIVEAAKVTEFNFFFAYLIPGFFAIKAANKLGIFVYDSDREISYWRVLKEVVLITVVADSMFYWIHRIVHTPDYYQIFHKKHHEWKYSMALAHHYMTFKEAVVMAAPQALPPLLMIPFIGKSHLVSMWLAFFVTQCCGIVGHAGYKIAPDWFPFFKASYHDWHHVDFDHNFAANFEFTDWLYGTLAKAPVATIQETLARAGERVHDYSSHMASRS